ncbi:MAG: hypothetical protein AAGJ55_02825 [Cyanobacteria bacterium J06555_12]
MWQLTRTSFPYATLRGYEAINMIRKGQISAIAKGEISAQVNFIHYIFGIAA